MTDRYVSDRDEDRVIITPQNFNSVKKGEALDSISF